MSTGSGSPSSNGTEAEGAIDRVLATRRPGATACPSEAARLLDAEHWRDRMDDVRRAAAQMAERGEIQVTQRGEVVDVRQARGPVRLGRVAGGAPGKGPGDAPPAPTEHDPDEGRR